MKLITLAARYSAISALFLGSSLMAQEIDLESDAGKAGYGIGVNIGMNIVNQMPMEDIDTDSLVQGVRDAIAGDLKMSEEEIMAAIQAFAMAQQSRMAEAQEAASQEGIDFLAQNGQRPEVTTTASGLQYEVIEEGPAGGESPSETDTVVVHYHGSLIDGTVFDSSVERGEPIPLPLNGVIPGWTEGIQLMSVGDKYRFYIPSELAYGANGAGQAIPPNSTLIFDVELLEIE